MIRTAGFSEPSPYRRVIVVPRIVFYTLCEKTDHYFVVENSVQNYSSSNCNWVCFLHANNIADAYSHSELFYSDAAAPAPVLMAAAAHRSA